MTYGNCFHLTNGDCYYQRIQLRYDEAFQIGHADVQSASIFNRTIPDQLHVWYCIKINSNGIYLNYFPKYLNIEGDEVKI